MGVISALGCGVANTLQALEANRKALQPVALFPVSAVHSLNVGTVDLADRTDVPRTHLLARMAAEQALTAAGHARPDAIVVGTATGGILTTEHLLESGAADPAVYACHGVGSVADDLARCWGCTGPVLTVSTACSSGALAIKLALEMLRSGQFKRVLAGGADSLSHLTYFGFKSLQLIDPEGARPMDRDRRGMSVAEGAAMLLLTTQAPENPGCRCQLLGAGLSCDAYHATSPHPDGSGALAAMQEALADAGLTAGAVDYINLHGTGTRDNDLAEAKAIHALFGSDPPPLSSIKGAMGHPLAAAGAIEAVVTAAAVQGGIVPANAGFSTPDPELNLTPLRRPRKASLNVAMSNSFGFGGNNAVLLIGRPRSAPAATGAPSPPLIVRGIGCISGAGHLQATREAFRSARSCSGCLDDAIVAEGLPPRMIRRLKRLPKLALALASRTCQGLVQSAQPLAVSLGTGWGALSETCDFLKRLADTAQTYPSPTDFVGSVHNAPAGQIAMLLGARGPNVTMSGGNYSFEQALWSAELVRGPGTEAILVLGGDEYHGALSPLLDASVRAAGAPADGGGALLVQRDTGPGIAVSLVDYRSGTPADGIDALIGRLGGARTIRQTYGAILAGCPAAHRFQTGRQLADFRRTSRFEGPVIDYRRISGEFAAASALAAVMGVDLVREGLVPAELAGGADMALDGKSILLLGLGPYLTAVRIWAQ